MSDRQRLHAQVYGRVQGVSFRYYTTLTAEQLDVTGWVRNRPDGSVEVVAEGTRAQLDRLMTFLNTGPSGARVSEVQAEWLEASGEFSRFEVR
jgi:acylphosphatase